MNKTVQKSSIHDFRPDFTRLRRALLAALLLTASVLGWATTKGPDTGHYTGTDQTVYSFVDISGTGGAASVLAGIDDGAVAVNIPFSFPFYSGTYSLVCVSSNGALYFITDARACSGLNDFASTDLTVAPPPNDFPALLPFWSDLTFQVPGAGSVLYQTMGTTGSRKFVVQWNNAYPQGSPNPVTFQVVLSEGTNEIAFQYQKVGMGQGNPASNGSRATVGIHNAAGLANGQQIAWSYAAPVLADSQALLFSTPARAKATVTLTADRNPARISQAVILTATVNSSTGTPTGNVTFFDGQVALSTVPLNGSGNVTYTASLSGGRHSLQASYSGDTNYRAGVSPVLSETVVPTLAPGRRPLPSRPATAPTPSATDGTSAGTLAVGPVAPAIQQSVAPVSPIGPTALQRIPQLSTSTATLIHTAILLRSSLNPASPGMQLAFTANVTSAAGIPSGLVTLKDGTAILGTAQLDSTGTAVVPAIITAVGTHQVVAIYEGDGPFAASSSALAQQIVAAK